ncbi:hypothetical protein [Phenylobacterium sp.]|uniref:hypothetical protein n=1 Tax=Phenylobacterium sp. TaxID=1871053 RepID=UPI002FC914CC
MSLRAMIASWGAPAVEFVGKASHNELTSGVPLHANAREGDYALFLYFPPRTISGGSGTAWNIENVMASTAKLAHRRLEPGDLTTPITLDDVSPVISLVYRGPVGISAERTSVAFTGTSVTMTGFTKSANAVAMIGLLHGDGDLGILSMTVGLPWASGEIQGPDAWFEGVYYLNDMAGYTNGAGIGVNGSAVVANKYAAVYELLY